MYHLLKNILFLGIALSLLLGPMNTSSFAFYQDEQKEEEKEKKKPKRDLPLVPGRKVEFKTKEATWMSIDISPDGQTVVMEVLGDLYTMPVRGGRATPITSGMAFDTQPRFSPDGSKIVFLSDRTGGENIYVLDADKTITDETKPSKKAGLVQITKGNNNLYASPEWTPDGKYIVVTKTSGSGSRHLWMHHAEGGSGVDLMKSVTNRWAYGAAFSNDDRYIYFSSNTVRPGTYNLTRLSWQIAVYDRETGEIYPVASRVGGAVRPALSSDGKWLVYATRHDAHTGFVVRDLESGDEDWLAFPVQRDDQESRFYMDLMPGYSFTPDNQAIITTAMGKLWRIEVPSGRKKEIKFDIDVSLDVGPNVNFVEPVDDGEVQVKQINDPRISPDGSKMVFNALLKLYIQELPNGTPRTLMPDMNSGQFQPAWSADSKSIAFVSWSDTEGGYLYKVNVEDGQPQRLTDQAAYYSEPVWRPDGSEIIVSRGSREDRTNMLQRRVTLAGEGRELFRIPVNGGQPIKISPMRGSSPHFADSNDRLYISEFGRLVSMRLDGTDRKEHVRVSNPTASRLIMGSDGQSALVYAQKHLYKIHVPVIGGEAPNISVRNPASAAFPVEKLSTIGANFFSWGPNQEEAIWAIGNRVFRYNFADARNFKDDVENEKDETADEDEKEESKDEKKSYEPAQLHIDIKAERYIGKGTVVLRGARIITMDPNVGNDGVIDDGAIVIEDNRITQVGKNKDIRKPGGAREIEVKGKTIVPGYVDTHAHLRVAPGVQRGSVWSYVANLAFGVVTTRDVQTSDEAVFTYTDLVETGKIVGPRIYATGPGVFSSDLINSLKDAQNVLKRYSEYYDTPTIKQYMVGNRKKRQWVIMAAKEQKLMPTLEGGLNFKKNITEIIDGYSGHEHTFPITPLYNDFIQLAAQVGTYYTPTLLVTYGGPWAENYYYTTTEVHDDPKVRRFLPHREIDNRSQRRPWVREEEHIFDDMAAQANKLVEAGGKVGVGSHGQFQGLAWHWELWAIQSGGMSEMNALKCATIFGAEAIGYAGDLGSIETGKMADLVVLNSNPLDNIRNSKDIKYVMRNGLLYEGDTLDMVWPEKKKFPKAYWWDKEPKVTMKK